MDVGFIGVRFKLFRKKVQLVDEIGPRLDTFYFLVEEIQYLLSIFRGFSCSYGCKEQNQVANCVAKHAVILAYYKTWLKDSLEWTQAYSCNAISQ